MHEEIEQVRSAELEVSFKGAMSIIDPIERVLEEARAKYESVVFDLTTTKGDKEARRARAEIVSIRTSADKAYSEWNKPILAEQRLAREKVAYIKDEVEKLERPIDEQIKAEEARRELERQAKAAAEAARIKAIRDRIAVISGLPTAVVDMSSQEIADVICDLNAAPLTDERFAEFLDEAKELVGRMLEKLEVLRESAAAREARELAIAAAQRQLEEDRRAQEAAAAEERNRLAAEAAAIEEARLRQEEAARTAQILAEEKARRVAEKAARDAADAAAQLKAQQDAFAAEREEAERVLREERDRVRAEREAMRRGREEQESAARAAEALPVAPAGVDSHQGDSSTGDLAEAPVAAPVEQEPTVRQSSSRPADRELVRVIANAYSVDEITAFCWLKSINHEELEVELFEVPI